MKKEEIKKFKHINTLEDLEAEQEKLELIMGATTEEFTKSFGETKEHLKTYMVKNVAIPAGAVGLGIFSLNQFEKDDGSGDNALGTLGLLAALAPLAKRIWNNYKIKNAGNPIVDTTLRASIVPNSLVTDPLVPPHMEPITVRKVDDTPQVIDLARKYGE